jgi:hypothetical protein
MPLPPATQWGIVKERLEVIRPAYEELIRQAAQGKVLCNDDTAMKILALARASRHSVAVKEEPLGSPPAWPGTESGDNSPHRALRARLLDRILEAELPLQALRATQVDTGDNVRSASNLAQSNFFRRDCH